MLDKPPVQLTSKAGKPYIRASARDGNGPDAKWWTVFVFSETAAEALEALTVGEAFAASGTFDATVWAPEGREPRVNLTLTADAVLSARKPPKAKPECTGPKPKEAKGPRDRAEASSASNTGGRASAASWASPSPSWNDDIPFAPEWR